MWRFRIPAAIGICLVCLLAFLSQLVASSAIDTNPVEQKLFGEDCNTDEECKETQFCSKLFGRCDCPSENTKWLGMYFSEDTRTCVNSVGKACTFEKDFMMDFLCGPNAICSDTEDMTLPSNFGVCKCKEGYIKDTKGHKCIIRPENSPYDDEGYGNGNELVINSGRAKQANIRDHQGDNEDDTDSSEDDGYYSDEVPSTDYPHGLSETGESSMGNTDENDHNTNSGTFIRRSSYLSVYTIIASIGVAKYMDIIVLL